MNKSSFVDHYEVLHLSPNADSETIERVFRLLAKRYHPDNGASGDEAKFRDVHTAYEILVDPERRAEYDVEYDEEKSLQWQIFEQGTALDDREDDHRIFHGILSLLYVARRRDPDTGGLGSVHFEKLLGVPREHLRFPIWYLKKRGLIERLDSGEMAITVDGIDRINSRDLTLPENRLLADSIAAADQASKDQLGISATAG
ncbi:MAG: J domain-containing protein [Gemmatimonadota bacterium]